MTNLQFNVFIKTKLVAYLDAHRVPNKWKQKIISRYKVDPWPYSTIISRAFEWSDAVDTPRDFFFLLHARWYTFCTIWERKLRGETGTHVNAKRLLQWEHYKNEHFPQHYERMFLIKYEQLFDKYC